MKVTRREAFAIPNILSYIRILLLPVFCLVYLNANTQGDYFMAGMIVMISGLTDLVDGKIARRFNAVTDLGKVLDPIADKLTLTVIAFCLVARFSQVIYLAIAILLKEVFMFFMTAYHLKAGRKLQKPIFFSKACTTSLFIFFTGLILMPHVFSEYLRVLVIFETLMVIVTIGLYHRAFKELKSQQSK